MLADYPSSLHTLAISTNFLDLSVAVAIGQVGAQGVLRHLELSTLGTNFKVDSIQEIMGNCRRLESIVLNDIEGERKCATRRVYSTLKRQVVWTGTPGA